MSTITFYVPGPHSDYQERRDHRVRVINHDEVSMTSKVEFSDGFTAIVRDVHLVTREA